MSLSNESCMAKSAVIDSNLIELNYFPFMTTLDKYDQSCNAVDDLSTKIFVPSKTKDVNVKFFNIKTGSRKAKALVKYISCD